jgi:hypothetical protein
VRGEPREGPSARIDNSQIKNLQIFDFNLSKWEEEPEPKSR